jgi:hypothetical protein
VKGAILVELGRLDAIDEEGNVKPYHDVFSDSDFKDLYAEERRRHSRAYSLVINEREVNSSELEEHSQDLGVTATRELAKLEPGVDLYPDQYTPPEHVRLAFNHLAPELFTTERAMNNDDKRFLALSIWRANKQGKAYSLSGGLIDASYKWLKSDRYSATFTPWKTKYHEIIARHQKLGEADPWLEIYQGTVKGQKIQKARLHWEKDYAIAMKNAYYYHNSSALEPPVDDPNYIQSLADAFDRWEKSKILHEDD